MPIQELRSNRENVLGKSLLGAIQGFTSGREMKRKQYEQSLANAKTMAELQKLQAETAGLANPGQIPQNPYTGKPAGFLYGGKFYQYQQPQNSLDALLGGMNDEEDNSGPGGVPQPVPQAPVSGGLPQRGRITFPQQLPGGGQTGQLSPQEHYNQLREAGYPPEQARQIAGV